MEYILDTADLAAIKHCNEFYPLSGVTTNPSIIAKENTDFWALVKNIRDIIGPDKLFFAQTVQTEASKIVEEACQSISKIEILKELKSRNLMVQNVFLMTVNDLGEFVVIRKE